MRIVIDMQGAQAENRKRGIGRYSTAITKAIIRNSGKHEIILILNDSFSETIEPIRAEFESLIEQENIRVWSACSSVRYIDEEINTRRVIAELTYEAFIAEQKPEFIYVTSLFEGLVDDAVTSIHQLQNIAPVAVTLYDLIPFINPVLYLDNPSVKNWYLEKIEHLKKADIWLAISESSRQEGISYLELDPARTYNISTDADEEFKKIEVSFEIEQRIRQEYNLSKPFLMYTGGIDHRKNIEGLIRAYARLPEFVRATHQLAIVCSAQPESRNSLEKLAAEVGLKNNEFILTGYVPGEDLIALYNICHLFVFPSWHEGFGLPALEAMRCGAPVIGANTSSLPEVIGWQQALFDPKSEAEMTAAIERGLTDENYRNELLSHQQTQAKKFSWDESAKRAISAMEAWYIKNRNEVKRSKPAQKKPRLAFLSPLPPARSGIADYSAELLPVLSKYYEIEVIVQQDEQVQNEWICKNLPIRDVTWFVDNQHIYDRVIYHFGNSSFHQHMFELQEKIPGVVVLHDFFLSGIQAHRDIHGHAPNSWALSLLQSHGYKALWERFNTQDTADVVWQYPTNLPILQSATGVIAHSQHSCELANRWYGANASQNWRVIPLLRKTVEGYAKHIARKELGLTDDEIIVCSFGVLGKTKLNDRLLNAWLNSPLSTNKKAHLIFVGQDDAGEYCQLLRKRINESTAHKRIKITGWTDSETFNLYLAAADIGVQLRTLSRGETSAAVLDCMNYGLATIVNAHGSMADLNPEGVWLLPDEFSDEELATALLSLANDQTRREQLSHKAQSIIKNHHSPEKCAAQYYEAIEKVYLSEKNGLTGLISETAKLALAQEEAIELCRILSQNFPLQPAPRKLLVDISELVQRDAKSGIQRVVRSILQQWLYNPPKGFQVEPVYATTDQPGYRYARNFTAQFMGLPDIGLTDDWVDAAQGDKFIGLDLQPVVIPAQHEYLKQWQRQGVDVGFLIYDLLPVTLAEHFPPEGFGLHSRWLETVAQFDAVYCISKAVAQEFSQWLSERNQGDRIKPISIQHFHLGADVAASAPSIGLADNADQLLTSIKASPSFLMVGTIEPRKGHAQVLKAFEQLWAEGSEVMLVIVGKQGWMVEELIERLRNHPETGKHLFCLEGISDEYLEKVYEVSTCLIAASYGEGFGLPLIEAAQHKIPIIARDIPVFREVAGEHAFYFDSKAPDDLATAIQEWLDLYQQGKHPRSDNMPWLTWEQSSENLIRVISGRDFKY